MCDPFATAHFPTPSVGDTPGSGAYGRAEPCLLEHDGRPRDRAVQSVALLQDSHVPGLCAVAGLGASPDCSKHCVSRITS